MHNYCVYIWALLEIECMRNAYGILLLNWRHFRSFSFIWGRSHLNAAFHLHFGCEDVLEVASLCMYRQLLMLPPDAVCSCIVVSVTRKTLGPRTNASAHFVFYIICNACLDAVAWKRLTFLCHIIGMRVVYVPRHKAPFKLSRRCYRPISVPCTFT